MVEKIAACLFGDISRMIFTLTVTAFSGAVAAWLLGRFYAWFRRPILKLTYGKTEGFAPVSELVPGNRTGG